MLFNGIEGSLGFQTGSSDADILVTGNVLCRTLGLPAAFHIGVIRSGNIPDWELILSQVRCQGNENSLIDCNYTIATPRSFPFFGVSRQILICSKGRLAMLKNQGNSDNSTVNYCIQLFQKQLKGLTATA